MGHQHDHEPIHDQGQGQAEKGQAGPGRKADEAGGGGRQHTASGRHESNGPGAAPDVARDSSAGTSGGGSGGSSGGSGGGHGSGHST